MSISGADVVASLRHRSVSLVTGVPCSFLAPVINAVITGRSIRYIGATSEGEAVGIAVGSWLAGGEAVTMCQNSGLGNMVNPLTSLVWPCRIPLLMICTWRGQPGQPDEPQHELMGSIMPGMLEMMQIGWRTFPAERTELDDALDDAWRHMRAHEQPFCFVLPGRAISPSVLREAEVERRPIGHLVRIGGSPRHERVEAIERLLEIVDDETAIIATTGKTGRELFSLADRPQHFYQVGAMGCASALGLGVAVLSRRSVVVIDGDGAALMKMGNMATIGVAAPPNLVHVLLDNGAHESTGGQQTAASTIELAEVARACRYAHVVSCTDLNDFDSALRAALRGRGPQLVHVRVKPGGNLRVGRPTVHPSLVARRFRDFLAAKPAVATAGVGP